MQRLLVTTGALIVAVCSTAWAQEEGAEAAEFTVTADEATNGSFQVTPAIPADGKVPAGTVLTLTASPAAGFAVDALYFSVAGPWGPMYHDTPSVTSLDVTVEQDMHVGAYFVDASAVEGITVTEDVIYATPGVKPLKYDVYAPEGAANLPCVVIIHGGGWRSNDEDIMRGMARQLAQSGKYVVFSIDYRWIGTADGDAAPNTMADLIGDVYGAIAHIREHAAEYGADPTRIAVTGDSAGGHLSAAAATMAHMIGDGGFGDTPGVYQYLPTYLPPTKTVEQVRDELMEAIRAVAPSYGVFAFGGSQMLQFLEMDSTDVAGIGAVSPIENIPTASERPIPHYLTRGTLDPIISDEGVSAYVQALVAAGQAAEYVQIGGASHAFFDWKPDATTVATFRQYGVYYVEEMEHFFDSVFYADE